MSASVPVAGALSKVARSEGQASRHKASAVRGSVATWLAKVELLQVHSGKHCDICPSLRTLPLTHNSYSVPYNTWEPTAWCCDWLETHLLSAGRSLEPGGKVAIAQTAIGSVGGVAKEDVDVTSQIVLRSCLMCSSCKDDASLVDVLIEYAWPCDFCRPGELAQGSMLSGLVSATKRRRSDDLIRRFHDIAHRPSLVTRPKSPCVFHNFSVASLTGRQKKPGTCVL